MMKSVYTGVMILMLAAAVRGQSPSAEDLLSRVDQHMVVGTEIATTTMTVHGRRSTRVLKAKSWIQGEEKSFSEYLAPPRDAGTKMLKLGNELWLYTPSSDRTIKIAGHMLRQSMMGSDLSYEDMLENAGLSPYYTGVVQGSDTLRGRACWVLELTAKREDAAYARRKIWVDQDRLIVLREHRFAKSGKLLKTTDVLDVFQVQGRWLPRKIRFKDALSKGKGTEFYIDSLELDVDLPPGLFSKAALRR